MCRPRLEIIINIASSCHCRFALPAGRTRISLRRSGEVFSHVPPQAKVHNLVLGRTWVDSYGSFIVTNTATGDKVHLEFKPCGWFGAGQHEFEGHVMDAEDWFCMLRA
mgnify:CR=1 FL=1